MSIRNNSRPFRRGWQLWKLAWPFLLPMFLWVCVFLLIPIVGTFYSSFFRDIAFMPRAFVGFENFRLLFADPAFLQAARFTGLFALISVPLEALLGLSLALVLQRQLPGRGFWRAAVILPWAIPAVVSAKVFQLIYQFQYGLLNFVFQALGFTDAPILWLGSAPSAFLALVIADAWKTAPFAALLFLAGLSGIPDELHRQARIDGAHFLQRFWRITLPLLKPTLTVVVLFRFIDALRVFDLNYVLTSGGPGGATTSLSLLGYQRYLSGDFGMGAAISVFLFACALIFTFVYLKRTGNFEGML